MRGEKEFYESTWCKLLRRTGLLPIEHPVIQKKCMTLLEYYQSTESRAFVQALDANKFDFQPIVVDLQTKTITPYASTSLLMMRTMMTTEKEETKKEEEHDDEKNHTKEQTGSGTRKNINHSSSKRKMLPGIILPTPPPTRNPASNSITPMEFIRAFLASDLIDPPGQKEMYSAICMLIPQAIRDSEAFAPMLRGDNPNGLLALLPGSAPMTTAGTLELHRSALAQERRVCRTCDMIRARCEKELLVIPSFASSIMTQEEEEHPASLDFILLCSSFGKGPDIWSEIPVIMGGGRLGEAMRALHAMRGTSMTRSYVVEDFLSWGMPILTRLFLHSRSTGAGATMNAARVIECITKLAELRRCAIVHEHQALLAYIARLEEIAGYLDAVMSMLFFNPAVAASSSSSPTIIRACISAEQAASSEKKKKKTQAEEEALRVIDRRKKQERGEVADMLQALQLEHSPLVCMQRELNAAICLAMQTDCHTLGTTKTCFLSPSKHLPDASYIPRKYLQAAVVGQQQKENEMKQKETLLARVVEALLSCDCC